MAGGCRREPEEEEKGHGWEKDRGAGRGDRLWERGRGAGSGGRGVELGWHLQRAQMSPRAHRMPVLPKLLSAGKILGCSWSP